MRLLAGFPSLLACLVGAHTALAVDGVLEINHACATAPDGCFPGDATGFPVTIANSGSYRLTSNLDSTSPLMSGISVSASDVSIDLNGFTVSGGFGSNETGVGGGGSNISVSNGRILGFHTGISLSGAGSRVHQVKVGDAYDVPIGLGDDCTLTESQVLGGATSGVITGSRCRVHGNSISYDTCCSNGWGLEVGARSIVSDNEVHNGDSGLGVGPHSTVTGNVVAGTDDGWGLYSQSSILINNNVSGADGDGIECGRCTLIGNIVSGSTGLGLRDSSGVTGYSQNHFDNNNGGNANPQVSGGIETGTNICGGDTTCP